jgi:hypothetical protein
MVVRHYALVTPFDGLPIFIDRFVTKHPVVTASIFHRTIDVMVCQVFHDDCQPHIVTDVVFGDGLVSCTRTQCERKCWGGIVRRKGMKPVTVLSTYCSGQNAKKTDESQNMNYRDFHSSICLRLIRIRIHGLSLIRSAVVDE